jgi:hypothetical protein
MTAPTVRAYASPTNGTDAAPAKTVNQPAGVQTGDLLIAFAGGDGTTAFTASPGNGWTRLTADTATSSVFSIYAKIASGTDALSIAAQNNQDYSVVMVAVTTGTHGVTNVSTDLVIPTTATGTTGNADPPASGTVASKDWLVFASTGVDFTNAADEITAYPTNYSAGVLTKSASSVSSVGLGVGHRALTAATSEDPGTFTNTSREWLANTVLVPSPLVSSPQTWTGNDAAVQVAATSGSFTPGAVTWTGSDAAVQIAATSGSFTPGAVTWTGNDAAVQVAAASSSFTPGAATWIGNDASVQVAATSGDFTGVDPGQTWTGSGAAVQVAATSGEFRRISNWSLPASATTTGGSSPQTWTGNAASVEVAATSGSFSAGGTPQTWTGNAATVTIVAASGAFIPGGATWTGSGVLVGIVAQSGAFIVGVPPPPTLVLDSKDSDQINMSWSAVSGATGYDIERNGSIIVWNHPTTSYSDTGLDPSTQYTHRVRGVFGGEPPFLTSVDVANKRLLDQYGNPWFGVGDAPWSLVGQLSEANITVYMEAAADKGINIIMFSAPEPYYTDNTPAYRNSEGTGYLPFTGTNFQSSLNNDYWVTVDHAIAEAKRLGITCLICPQYIGYGGDGWETDLVNTYNSSPSSLTTYGQALASRYGSETNIVWLIGHDDNNITATLKAASKLIADELPANHLLAPGGHHDFADGTTSWASSGITFDFDTNYDYGETPGADTASTYASRTTMFIEGKYEQEQSMGVGNAVLRWQMWEPLLAGSCGTIMGNNPRWHFQSGKELYGFSGTWQDSFTNAAYNDSTVHLSHLAAFISANPSILTATPDTTNTFLTSPTTDYARFSTTIGVAYRTANTSTTLDTTELGGTGNVKIRRFDPTSGSYTTVAASEAQNAARSITYPGANAAGGTDWVYIVELV